MRFRRLRIAGSVFWIWAAVLLIVLWIRSYATIYWCCGMPHSGRVVHLQAAGGLAILFVRQETPAWEAGNVPRKYAGQDLIRPYTGFETPPMMAVQALSGKRVARLQVWLGAVLPLVCAMIPWASRKFSLRTLLISITLVAVVSGLVVLSLS
jgi:hypothetical protein